MRLPGLERFLAAHPEFLHRGPAAATPPGWWDQRRLVEMLGVHARMVSEPYLPDMLRYGRADHWAIDYAGDCEDKCLAAHRDLAELGWPRAAMQILVRPKQGALAAHAVLLLHLTIDGAARQVALDNLARTPVYRPDLAGRGWEAA